MKKMIAVFCLICLSINLCGCCYAIPVLRGYSDRINSNTTSTEEENKYDTAYPNDVFVQNELNVITVERAEADLRKIANRMYPIFPNGYEVEFERRADDIPNRLVSYVFIVSTQYTYSKENYRMKIHYRLHDGWLSLDEADSFDIDQIDSTFTDMGTWTYDDEETHIMVNFIRYEKDKYGIVSYIVEYEITYYARYWSGSEWIESVSDGEQKVFGDNEPEENSRYLSIDLGEFYDENGERIKRGRIEVYPEGGVYWDALYANGPYELTKG